MPAKSAYDKSNKEGDRSPKLEKSKVHRLGRGEADRQTRADQKKRPLRSGS